VDVKEETDTKEIPPCMILKSDGAALYNTTDLATIMERMELYNPDTMIYVVDKRQDLYFDQVFRCARKTKLINENTRLKFLGFGTMNGKDGKPFKTREGGIMRLENLLSEINDEMYSKITENHAVSEEEAKITSKIVALAAIKYGDLSNQASKDYMFDIERFTSFEGDTGPYLLYTMVRIKSILNKYKENGGKTENFEIQDALSLTEKDLMLEISKFNNTLESAFDEIAPHKICAYVYGLANAFNSFYHETKILAEEDKTKQEGFVALLVLSLKIMETCIDLLGFEAPERM
jgi:arginyl-tRNA synthetase